MAYLISATEVKPKLEKIKAVKEFPGPRISKNVKQFLGLAGYYRRFISNFSSMSKTSYKSFKERRAFQMGRYIGKGLQLFERSFVSETFVTIP